MTRIGIVDDDEVVNDSYAAWIRREFPNIEIDQYTTFGEAHPALSRGDYDAVLLDIELGQSAKEKIGGFPLAQVLRDREIPVLIVSGTPKEALYKTIMTSLFAWDYLEKPIEEIDLLTKVRQILDFSSRKKDGVDHDVPPSNELVINPFAKHQVTWKGRPVTASMTQIKILQHLIERQDQVVPYEDLSNLCPSSRGIENLRGHIKDLRDSFKDVESMFDRISNVTLKGYMWRSK